MAFLLLITPLVVVATFFGPVKGGNFLYFLCRCWADFVLFFAGIRVKYIDLHHIKANQQYVFVFNHIAYMDIPILMKAIRKHPIRVLGKAELKKIPIFGYIYKHAAVTVDRKDEQSRSISVARLKDFIKNGISIVVAPEGTFNFTNQPLKEMYNGAFRIAIETQTPILPMVFLDNFDRNSNRSIFSVTPGPARIVYLPAISVSEYTLDDVEKLKQQVAHEMEKTILAYNASWLKAKPLVNPKAKI